MSLEFKKNTDKKIDNTIDQVVKSFDKQQLEVDKLTRQGEQLWLKLKSAIRENHTADDQLTNNEWHEIYQSIPKDLLSAFSIHDKEWLKFFVLSEWFFRENYDISYVSNVSNTWFVSVWFRQAPSYITWFRPNIARVDTNTGEIMWRIEDFLDQVIEIIPIKEIKETGIIQWEKWFARIDIDTWKVLWKKSWLHNFDMLYENWNWITDNDHYLIRLNPDTWDVLWNIDYAIEWINWFKMQKWSTIFFNNGNELAYLDLNQWSVVWKLKIPSELWLVEANYWNDISSNGVIKCEKWLLRVDKNTWKILWILWWLDKRFWWKYYWYSREWVISDWHAKPPKIAKIDLNTWKILWVRTDLPISISIWWSNFVVWSNATRFLSNNWWVSRIDSDWNMLFQSSDIPKDKIESLKSLWITWYERFYSLELVDQILQNRELVSQRNVEQLNKKPIVAVFYPRRDENKSYLHNNIDWFVQNYNVLYYEIENEADYYRELQKLQSLWVNIDILVMWWHSTHEHMSFWDKDPAQTDNLNEELVLDFSDKAELLKYSSLFNGSIVISTWCETWKWRWLRMNLVNLFSETLWILWSEVIWATKSVNTYFEFWPNGKYLRTRFFWPDGEELNWDEVYSITN